MSIKYPIIRPTLPSFAEVESDLRAILTSGMVTTSSQTRAFEEVAREVLEVDEVIALNSCTAGLMLAFRGLDLRRGEVLIPSFTFTATALAAVWAGMKPVFVDCEPDTLTLDLASARASLTKDTVAIMPVAVFGNPTDAPAIDAFAQEHGLKVIYDSAQGLGAQIGDRPIGGFGNVEIFSLSPTKVITAVEGGLFATNDRALAGRIRQMRDYGKSADGEDIEFLGLSARFSEFHAVIGRHNLEAMSTLREARLERMTQFRAELAGLPGVSFIDPAPGRTGSGIYMVLRVDASVARCSRDDVVARLAERAIQGKKYFTPPVHLQAAYRNLDMGTAPSLEASIKAAAECMAIPLYADMSPSELGEVAAAVREILG